MTTRSRQHLQNDWDPMRDDYNDTTYDPQYPDDDSSGGVNLDHCRLYITNIPKGLNDEGLRTAFASYGTLNEVHISKDPVKRYGLVSYHTAGEAKLAMTKLNRTEPLKLNISIAHKKKNDNSKNKEHNNRQSFRERPMNNRRDNNRREDNKREDNRSDVYRREEIVSVGSRGSITTRRNDDVVNGDDGEIRIADEDLDILDPDLNLELEQLKLEQLKLKEAQLMCKHRILIKKAEKKVSSQSGVGNRKILPDGRIVVSNDRSTDRDAESTFTTGAGDSLIPALQRLGCRSCVACGAPAELYCGKCALTPYCGERCQRRDWLDRHKSVCHNLARWSTPPEPRHEEKQEPTAVPLAPLRRPRSPVAPPAKRESAKREQIGQPVRREQNDEGAQHRPRKFVPAGSKPHNRQDNQQSQQRNNRNFNGNKFEKFQKPEEEEEDWTVKAKPAVVPSPMEEKKKETIVSKPLVKPTVVEPVSEFKQASINVKKLVPETYLVDMLAIGDVVLLSVESTAASCKHSDGRGFVCLSLHERYEASYETLCSDYVLNCEKETAFYKPVAGESFSYFEVSDGAWYRARCLSPAQAALLDGGRLVSLAGDKHKRLPDKYAAIPEFCCVLVAAGVQIGENLKCSLLAKTQTGYKVSIENVDTSDTVGEGEVTRWTPEVEVSPSSIQTIESSPIPEVTRPDLVNNSKVFLVDATKPENTFVRPSDVESQKLFDGILQDVVFYGTTSTPLSEPPKQGQEVVGKFSDGLHYRALCKRTNVKQNKYLLEYIEFGNVEVTSLENISACPARLALPARPTVVARARLPQRDAFTPPALHYIERLKDDTEELLLNLTSGANTAPSGAEVRLTLLKNNESVNKTLEDMCTPEWKKIAERNGEILDCESVMYSSLEYLELDSGPVDLDVLESSTLQRGSLSGCPRDHPHKDYVFNTLAAKMAEYCTSAWGGQQYLPKREEMCIVQLPGSESWHRAVMCGQEGGAGSGSARVLLADCGRVELVPVAALRKMMAEFVVGLPALALTIDIKDFPEEPTDEMLSRAREHLRLDAQGRGRLRAARALRLQPGVYELHAPDLIHHMTG